MTKQTIIISSHLHQVYPAPVLCSQICFSTLFGNVQVMASVYCKELPDENHETVQKDSPCSRKVVKFVSE
jgi:hypothetical protein